jgi:beta-lactamase regulating signal transducer with metallopeptidase domain
MSALLGWLWQGTALALAVALVLRSLPRVGAAARHTIWWLTLLAVLGLPLCHLVPAAQGPPGVAGATTSPLTQPLLVPAPPDWAVALLLGAWLGMLVWGLVRILRGVALLRRLGAGALPLESSREDRLGLWRRAQRVGRRCGLRASAHVHGACALGLWRPVIVVSHDLLETLDDEDLDQVVMHEHAHLARYDDWTRLAQAIIEAVAGLHPAVAVIGRQIDIEREAACDDRVVAQTGQARRYAACLATVGTASLGQRVGSAATLLPGMARARGTLLQRVARLLDPRRGHSLRLDPTAAVVTVAALMLAVASSRHAGPMVETVETDEPIALASPAGPRPVLPAPPAGVPAVEAPASMPPARFPAEQGERPAPTAAARAVGQSSLAAPSPQAGTAAPEPAVIETRGLHAAVASTGPPSVAPVAPPSLTAREAGDGSPWAALVAPGTSVGTGGTKAGVAVARFFSRAAKAAASSF